MVDVAEITAVPKCNTILKLNPIKSQTYIQMHHLVLRQEEKELENSVLLQVSFQSRLAR